MKRTYIIPKICVVMLQHNSYIALSCGVNGVMGDDDIGYGGVDLDGSVIPDVKFHNNIWNDEW